MSDLRNRILPHVGLCSVCSHVKKVENRRGSAFYLCRRAQDDPTFSRYPRLPVLVCRGFEVQRVEDAAAPTRSREDHDADPE